MFTFIFLNVYCKIEEYKIGRYTLSTCTHKTLFTKLQRLWRRHSVFIDLVDKRTNNGNHNSWMKELTVEIIVLWSSILLPFFRQLWIKESNNLSYKYKLRLHRRSFWLPTAMYLETPGWPTERTESAELNSQQCIADQ